MHDARRHTGANWALVFRVSIAWLLVSSLLLIVNWNAIAAQRFPDPDDILRLVQVRDLVAGQPWFDLTQVRVDAANGGVDMHWSRLVDLPLATIIIVLSPLLGSANAELVAVLLVPSITLWLAMYLAARIAWHLLGEEEAVLTCLVIALSIPAIFQLGPLRIDHHGWQLVCALLAINGLMSASARTGGWTIGIALALWLSISIEGLPLAAAIFAVLAWRWLRDRSTRDGLVSAIQGLAFGGVALFMVTRGWSDFTTYCDAIGPSHLAMFIWGAIILTALAWREPLPRFAIWAGFAVAGGGAVAIFLTVSPHCIGGGFSELDPVVREYWLDNVTEGMPIWRQSALSIAQFAITPVIGIWAALKLASRSHDWARQWWREYAFVLASALAVSILVARAGAVAGVLAAVPLAWQVRQWLRAIRLITGPVARLGAILSVMLALLPAFPVILAKAVLPIASSNGAGSGAAPIAKASSCEISAQAAELRVLEPGEIFAPLDIAPQLLLHSDHSVVATGHHRGNRSIAVLIDLALGSASQAQAILSERGTTYVALCPQLAEPNMYAQVAPRGFMAQLMDGKTPDWLEPIAAEQSSGLMLWRVRSE